MSKKNKLKFKCTECDHITTKWIGKCPDCGQWDTLVEFEETKAPRNLDVSLSQSEPIPLNEVSFSTSSRLSTGNSEFDRALGGGFAPQSLLLIGGDPGIGKSTLLLQTAVNLQTSDVKTLYVTGEESAEQIKLRANRLNMPNSNLKLFCHTELNTILNRVKKEKPDVLIIDSIQTMYKEEINGTPGSVSQIRECTMDLMVFTKNVGCITILIGHVTKEGQIAGPRMLEHMVDTVIYFEGDSQNNFRILRSIKNRFGPSHEIGVLEMQSTGLYPVTNPSGIFIQNHEVDTPGTVVSCTQEGTRSMLFEIQALVNQTNYSVPQKVTLGIDTKRITVILAILEKFGGVQIGMSDVFVSMAGGIKIEDPAIDLALALAIASNHLNISIPKDMLVLGEVGLSGEIRKVSQLEGRLKEAKHLGFEKALVPRINKAKAPKGMELLELGHISGLMELFE